MTPAARYQAAIEIIDRVLDGAATEQALTAWARGSRYAGSKDRAAVRDHVFDAVRCLRSYAALGGARSGRGIVLGGLREAGIDPETIFTGVGHAPTELTSAELGSGRTPEGADAVDLPDWLWQAIQDDLGAGARDAAMALRSRAGVHLRVNVARITRDDAMVRLAADGIETRPNPAAETALTVTEGARRVRQSAAYADGLVELQDAASQALALALPLEPEQRVLDYCAGGGGKTLAMAARMPLQIYAHDAAPERMRDLPTRAQRAGAQVHLLETGDFDGAGPFDLVLCDAPCSGSGAWRRAPDAKWALTPDRLTELGEIQSDILDRAARLVVPGGILAYATCSVLAVENVARVARFTETHDGWSLTKTKNWPICPGTDGFFLAFLTRNPR